jgi:PST family polysaccharide transporter
MVQLAFRVVAAGLTFLLVQGPGQAWVVMGLYAATSVATWIASDILLYRRVAFRPPMLRPALDAVRGASALFVGTVGATLYTSFNVVLLGLFVPSTQVARFGAGERILRVSLQVLAPIGTAVYPRLAALQASERHDRARQLLVVAIVAVGGVALLLAGGLALFAPIIVRILFGPDFVHQAVPVLRVLVIIIPVGVVGSIAGSWLMTLHMDRVVVRIVLGAGALNVALGCVMAPLFGPVGMAWCVVIAEIAAAAGGMVAVLGSDRLGHAPLFARREGELEPLAPAELPTADLSPSNSNS